MDTVEFSKQENLQSRKYPRELTNMESHTKLMNLKNCVLVRSAAPATSTPPTRRFSLPITVAVGGGAAAAVCFALPVAFPFALLFGGILTRQKRRILVYIRAEGSTSFGPPCEIGFDLVHQFSIRIPSILKFSY